MDRFEADFGKWVVKRRWWLLVATVIVAFTAASGMRLLRFSNDGRVFFSGQNPQLKALEALEDTYTKNQSVLFVVAPKDGNVFSKAVRRTPCPPGDLKTDHHPHANGRGSAINRCL